MDWILDTGAEVNVIGEEHLKQFGNNVKRQPSCGILKAFNSNVAQNCGTVNIVLSKDDKQYNIIAHVVKNVRTPLLGFTSTKKMWDILQMDGQ